MKFNKFIFLDQRSELYDHTVFKTLHDQKYTCIAICTNSSSRQTSLEKLIQQTEEQLIFQDKLNLQNETKEALILLAKNWFSKLQNFENMSSLDIQKNIEKFDSRIEEKLDNYINVIKNRLQEKKILLTDINKICQEKRYSLLTELSKKYCVALDSNTNINDLIQILSSVNKEKTEYIVTNAEQKHIKSDEIKSSELFLKNLQTIKQLKKSKVEISYVFYDCLTQLKYRFFDIRDYSFLNHLEKHEGIIFLGKHNDEKEIPKFLVAKYGNNHPVKEDKNQITTQNTTKIKNQ